MYYYYICIDLMCVEMSEIQCTNRLTTIPLVWKYNFYIFFILLLYFKCTYIYNILYIIIMRRQRRSPGNDAMVFSQFPRSVQSPNPSLFHFLRKIYINPSSLQTRAHCSINPSFKARLSFRPLTLFSVTRPSFRSRQSCVRIERRYGNGLRARKHGIPHDTRPWS